MAKDREEIRSLMESLVAMSDEVGVILTAALKTFGRPDAGTTATLVERDKVVNRMENAHDAKCLRILALYQPEADDLRTVFMALKINNDLERIADHALNVAERAESMGVPPPPPCRQHLERMGALSQGMLTDAITAFVARDSALAKNVINRDDEVDELLREVVRETLERGGAGGSLETAVGIVLAAKELERIADLCTNLAEDVVFMAEGTNLKHHGEM